MASASRGGGGWMATGLGLGVLAVLGFGLGLAVGGLWSEPGLVLHHVLGGTEEVAWDSTPETGASPDGAPAPVAAPPRSAPPGAAGPIDASGFAVQVGAFAESGPAEALAESLRARGYPAYLAPGTGDGPARWRVRVGPLASRPEAERTAARLKGAEKLPTWILSERES